MDILRVKINGEWTDIPAIVGPDGTTFIPSVDSQGNLSWSNTGGQPNPPTVNIKGPQGQAGRDGAPGQTGAAGTTFIPYVASNGDISWSNADGKPNPATVNIKGPQGETGERGPQGEQGPQGDPGDSWSIHICTSGEYDATTRVPTIQNPDTSTFYLVPEADGASPDLFVEWIYVNNVWEIFGRTKVDVSDKADKVANATSGNFAALDANGNLTDSGHKHGDYLTEHQTIPVTDVQVNGTSVVSQGVANVPIAGADTLGVLKVGTGSGGVELSSGELKTAPASAPFIKAGTNGQRPLVPYNQHEAVFYGLAKLAGVDLKNSSTPVGTYPDEAKAAIKAMLGIT